MANRILAGTGKKYLLVISLLAAIGVSGSVVKVATTRILTPTPQISAAPDSGAQSAKDGRSAPRSEQPLPFEPNAGQADAQVSFVARSRVSTLFFTRAGLDVAFQSVADPGSVSTGNSIEVADHSRVDRAGQGASAVATKEGEQHAARVQLQFLDANSATTVSGGALLPGKANYLVGNDPSKWLSNLDTYSSITYKDLYQGVTLV